MNLTAVEMNRENKTTKYSFNWVVIGTIGELHFGSQMYTEVMYYTYLCIQLIVRESFVIRLHIVSYQNYLMAFDSSQW